MLEMVEKNVLLGKMTSDNSQIQFQRCFQRPFISPMNDTFFVDSVTTADVVEYGGGKYVFFAGMSEGHERIGLALLNINSKSEKDWRFEAPKMVVDENLGLNHEIAHVADPAAVIVNNTLFLYFSAISKRGDSIFLSRSNDWENYNSYFGNPILPGRSPEIVFYNNVFYLFYVLPNKKGGYSIYLATSTDGLRFAIQSQPVLYPSIDSWDSLTITTPRIIKENDYFFMIYAGDDVAKDDPKHFGLAYSKDLINWKKYEHNPVFSRGPQTSWDDWAIWFGTLFRQKGSLYLLYEGSSYSNPKKSQIGLALLD